MTYNQVCEIEISIKKAIEDLVNVEGVDFNYFQSRMEMEGVYDTINECLNFAADIVEDDE